MTQEAQKKILVIEDEEAYRRVLTERLGNEGFAVFSANDGEKGLAIALEKRPDLILLDLVLPKMDGMTMLYKLRDYDEWGKRVPVFILTALPSADEQRSRDITKLEPTYYLEKASVRIEDLIMKIRERINR